MTDTEDYERRIRNLERVIIAISALVAPDLHRGNDEGLDRACEAFFYSISKGGINKQDMCLEPPPEVIHD